MSPTRGEEVGKLPANESALLTILHSESSGIWPDRPIDLARGKFVVPVDFNEPLPDGMLRDFAGHEETDSPPHTEL